MRCAVIFLVLLVFQCGWVKNSHAAALTENFDLPLQIAWQPIDEGIVQRPSNWSVSNSVLMQSSNIYGPDFTAESERKGTYMLYNNVEAYQWQNYIVSLKVRSLDNDGIGVLFGYKDPSNYYKFEMDLQRNFRKIFKVVNGIETTLATVAEGYTVNTEYHLQVSLLGDRIGVDIDGVDVFGRAVVDSSHSEGSIALFCWGNEGCFYDDLKVELVNATAIARLEQNITDADGDGSETLLLDGSQSIVYGQNPVYRWTLNGQLIAIGQYGSVVLPVGTHNIQLAVTDLDVTTTTLTRVTVESSEIFRFIVVPDTQIIARNRPEIFYSHINWIAENHQSLNTKFVMHVGDIVNDNNHAQWNIASEAMGVLDGVVPYSVLPGNHDMGVAGSSNTRDSSLYNQYFPLSRFSDQAGFGGVYSNEPTKYDNNFHEFQVDDVDWLVIFLEFGPRDSVVDWANAVVESHANHRVIVVTHTYLHADNAHHDASRPWNPHLYGLASEPGGVNDGKELWEKFVRKHKNISFVFNGHVLGDGLGFLESTGDHGNTVYQFLTNYQMNSAGGNGFLRILELNRSTGNVAVRAYSPYLDVYKTDPQNQFNLQSVDLGPPMESIYFLANAGPDQFYSDTNNDGTELVQLDASSTSIQENAPAIYEWYRNGQLLATGVSPELNLGLGQHEFALRVSVNGVVLGNDSVNISVSSNLLNEDFNSSAFTDWKIVDSGQNYRPSVWQVNNGRFVQSSNIYGPHFNSFDHRQGTTAVYNSSSAYNWSDYTVTMTIAANDNDGIGLLFYYKDENNYYKLDSDEQRGFVKLFKMNEGVESLLAAKYYKHALNTDIELSVENNNGVITSKFNGEDLFGPVVDHDLTQGSIALYCWGNEGCVYDRVVVSN